VQNRRCKGSCYSWLLGSGCCRLAGVRRKLRQGGQMLHRTSVSDKALGLLMDRCRATFANPEADGSFTLYANTNRNEVKYRVTARMHRAAEKCIRTGVLRPRGDIDPIRVNSGIRAGMSSTELVPPMPRGHHKKACACGHGIAIHHIKRTASGVAHPCNHPGCKCKDYKPTKK